MRVKKLYCEEKWVITNMYGHITSNLISLGKSPATNIADMYRDDHGTNSRYRRLRQEFVFPTDHDYQITSND